jgi:predicted nucleic acid-binding protein
MALRLGWRSPRRLPLVDALISASAQVRDATLIHRDEHMRGIPADMVQQIDFAD